MENIWWVQIIYAMVKLVKTYNSMYVYICMTNTSKIIYLEKHFVVKH